MFPQPSSGLEALYGNKEGILDRSWVPVSEDSFTCNVFAPAGADKLSVLVWIYGGSLNNGSADKQLYDPSEWIRREEQAGRRFLIVTLNYRTNIFGEPPRACHPRSRFADAQAHSRLLCQRRPLGYRSSRSHRKFRTLRLLGRSGLGQGEHQSFWW